MAVDFEKLEQNYIDLASHATIVPKREAELASASRRLLRDKEVYKHVESLTHVPAAALMALAEREMTGNLHCYLGNGQRLDRRTTIVPINRGPFPDTPEGFVAGCLDALHLDGLDQVWRKPGGWSLPRFCYESEGWNGWGYRSRGIPSPYVFGATSVQRPGKFPRDHFFDPNMMDPQLGTLALVEEIVKLDPSLEFFADEIVKVDAPSIIPTVDPHPTIGGNNIFWVQSSLNKLRVTGTPLLVDGNCGRGTRGAIRAFEIKNHLSVDRGIPGPQVMKTLRAQIDERGLA